MEQNSLLQNLPEQFYAKKKVYPCLAPFTKINSKCMVNLNVKPKCIKLLENELQKIYGLC